MMQHARKSHFNVSYIKIWTLHVRHVYAFDAALLWGTVAVDTSPRWPSWLSGGSLFRVGTQLGECRYKFLRRWAQYGNHSGTQDWEINQYQTGWIRASVWSFFHVNLFFFALFFSSHLHLLIGGRSCASVCLAVVSVFAICCILLCGPRYGTLGRSWKEMEASALLCLFAVAFTGDATVNTTLLFVKKSWCCWDHLRESWGLTTPSLSWCPCPTLLLSVSYNSGEAFENVKQTVWMVAKVLISQIWLLLEL